MSPRAIVRNALFRLLRAGFRLLPLPVAVRDRWRQRFLNSRGHWIPTGPRGQQQEGAAIARRARQHSASRAIGHVPHSRNDLPDPLPATLVAFYLPQFHSIPENDSWWGEGFTEWHNVTRALPQFVGHAQPRLPGALGFYDLRLPQVMRRQMQLAREYGVGAFCSYFYWFAGKTLLEQPLRQWLTDPSLELPLCLCWANENWSRRWDGRAQDILMAQRHSAEDDLAFIAHVAPYLRDPRYLRADGKPLLLVYRPGLLPDAAATARRWRDWCSENNVGDIELAYVQSFDRVDPAQIGFDAAVEFPPNNVSLKPITAQQHLLNPEYHGDVLDWRELAKQSINAAAPDYRIYPGVNPAWDNEPRRSGRGRVLAHASPRGYRDWLTQAITRVKNNPPGQRLVFVNAWNEWAEGAVLEPDVRLGHAWLAATREALWRTVRAAPAVNAPYVVVHVWYVELLEDIAAVLKAATLPWRLIITTAHERADAVRKRVAELGIDARIESFENRGRDILPFLHVANQLLDEGVEIVLKLHTKRSTHRRDGETWRRELLEKLAAPARAATIVETFRQQPTLGLVHAEGHRQRLDYFWGANRDNVQWLAAQIGIPAPRVDEDSFVAGSMFWVRLPALRTLLDAHLDPQQFETEAGQLDGTQAHAIERLFVLVIQAAGYDCWSAAAVCGQPEDSSTPYPYAARG